LARFQISSQISHQQVLLPGDDEFTHFRSGRLIELTPEGVEHLRYQEPALFKGLSLHPDGDVNARTRRVIAGAQAVADAPPPAPKVQRAVLPPKKTKRRGSKTFSE
jgi:hypothetical protein